jgi:hypothetical protein
MSLNDLSLVGKAEARWLVTAPAARRCKTIATRTLVETSNAIVSGCARAAH